MRRRTNRIRNATETERELEFVRDCLLVDESSLCMPMRERGTYGEVAYSIDSESDERV